MERVNPKVYFLFILDESFHSPEQNDALSYKNIWEKVSSNQVRTQNKNRYCDLFEGSNCLVEEPCATE